MPASSLTARQIFDNAHEITSPLERNAYLDQVCASSPQLRRVVDGLLRAYDEMDSHFLSSPNCPLALTADLTSAYAPASETSDPAETPQSTDHRPASQHDEQDDWVGKEIGPYKLQQKLGKGGMGLVYLAQQEKPIRRQVALKFVLPGKDSAHALARFDTERQALSMMDHANIAKVLDAGTTAAGQPYYVMEFIAGTTFTKFCNEKSQTIRERLEMFAAICQGVQHAHQRGIIHRDLKPDNILVAVKDGKPLAKIIDFGLAKATAEKITDHLDLTRVGDIVGTWKYMSPEQAEGGIRGIDTRTDIYSLGVILYELLSGTVVIDGLKKTLGVHEFLQKLKEDYRQRPSDRVGELGDGLSQIAAERKIEPGQLARLLRGELDWITLKAVETSRDRRYQTASEFSNDIQHYLNDEPVAACPPSARYRIGKFVRKNRLVVGSVSAVIAALVLGAAGLTVGLVRAFTELVRANTAEGNEREAKGKAEKDRDAAIHAEKIQGKLLNITRSGIRSLIYEGSSLDENSKTILSKIVVEFSQIVTELSTQSEQSRFERELVADTEYQAANINHLLRKYQEADPHYQKAIEIYEDLITGQPSEPKFRDDIARCAFDYAHLLTIRKKTVEAEGNFRRSIDLFKVVVADFPTETGNRSELARAYNDFGVLLREEKRLKQAEDAFREAIAIGKDVLVQMPNVQRYRINLAASYGNLGNVVRDQGDPKSPIDWYGKDTELLKPITQGKPNELAVVKLYLRNACWDRANARGQLGLHADANRDWQVAIAMNSDHKPEDDHLKQFLTANQMELKLKTEAKPTGSLLYDAAMLNARGASAAQLEDETSLKDYYARRTLELLKQAKTAGFFDDPAATSRLEKDQQFKELLKTSEFQAFLTGLSEAAKKPKPPSGKN